jgi:ABC-type multidrug transport system fused ATPase/permease subunit
LYDTIINVKDRFPNGFETKIHARMLSGGEAARISVARAMLSRAELLIFDEPTAAVDSKTERKMREGLDLLHTGNCTLLVIAHRLSTIQKANKVIVMDNGRIVQMGTYNELIETEGLFKDYCKELSLV